MKKTILKSLLAFAFITMHLSLNAQFSWFQQFRTDGKDVYTDGTHVWRIGYFDNTTTIGSTTLTSNGNYDILVTKSDINGNVVWAKSFGSTKEDRGTALCVDPSGNVYITGLFKEQTTIGSDSYTSEAGYWQPNGYLAKLDNAGSMLWSRPITCTEDCEGVSLAYDAVGDNVYLAAKFLDTLTLGTNVLTGQSYMSCIAKVTASGVVSWANGYAQHDARELALDAAGNVCFLYGTIGTTANSYVKKIDPSGNSVSTLHFPGVIMRSFCIDGLSNIWAAGSLIGTATLGTSTLTAQNWDVVVAKADASGTITFAKNYGGANSEHGISICADPSNNVFVAGNKASTDMLDTHTASGSAFFMQLNNAGAEQWLGTIPGTNMLGDQAHGLCSDNAGNIFATGYFDAWAGNPITVNGNTYTVGGGFFARLNPGGTPPLGMGEFNLSAITFYPNPASEVVTIHWMEEIRSYKVSSLSGQQFDLELNGNTLNVSDLPSGVYFLELQSDETIQQVRFIKK
jgi:hypothetical protein